MGIGILCTRTYFLTAIVEVMNLAAAENTAVLTLCGQSRSSLMSYEIASRAGFKILKPALGLPRKVGSFEQNLVLTKGKFQKSIRYRFLKQPLEPVSIS